MGMLWKPSYDAVKYRTKLSDAILRQLNDVGMDFRVMVGVGRELMVGKFDEPVEEIPVGLDIEVAEKMDYKSNKFGEIVRSYWAENG
jgi:hypothetical protein